MFFSVAFLCRRKSALRWRRICVLRSRKSLGSKKSCSSRRQRRAGQGSGHVVDTMLWMSRKGKVKREVQWKNTRDHVVVILAVLYAGSMSCCGYG